MTQRKVPQVGERLQRTVEIEKAAPRTMRFVASDETVDRYGDIIRVDGWELANYERNPQLLFAHKGDQPIGTAKVWIDGKQLLAEAKFYDEGVNQKADEVWRMVDANGLRAVSVGFLPTVQPKLIRDEPDEDGYARVTGFEFIGHELLELSVVSVPANPQALALARSLAIRPETIRAMFDDDPRASAQAALIPRVRSLQLARLRRAPAIGG